MGFQETGLISDVGVTNGMRFVESIRSESLPVSPDFVDQFFDIFSFFFGSLDKIGIVFTTFDEFAFQFRQQFELLFTHSFTEGIRLSPGEQSQGPGLEHHLFLVDGNAVSVFQVGLHHRMVVFNGFFAVFAPDEGRDILHRPRTIQGVHGYQVLETVGLEGAEVFFHSGRLELEQPGGISAGEKLEGFFVVQGNFVFIQDDVFRFFDIVETSLDDREGT